MKDTYHEFDPEKIKKNLPPNLNRFLRRKRTVAPSGILELCGLI